MYQRMAGSALRKSHAKHRLSHPLLQHRFIEVMSALSSGAWMHVEVRRREPTASPSDKEHEDISAQSPIATRGQDPRCASPRTICQMSPHGLHNLRRKKRDALVAAFTSRTTISRFSRSTSQIQRRRHPSGCSPEPYRTDTIMPPGMPKPTEHSPNFLPGKNHQQSYEALRPDNLLPIRYSRKGYAFSVLRL
jgi:hypothetical protein